jgi:hypothetical protein
VLRQISLKAFEALTASGGASLRRRQPGLGGGERQNGKNKQKTEKKIANEIKTNEIIKNCSQLIISYNRMRRRATTWRERASLIREGREQTGMSPGRRKSSFASCVTSRDSFLSLDGDGLERVQFNKKVSRRG